jgi:hypothetical protein
MKYRMAALQHLYLFVSLTTLEVMDCWSHTREVLNGGSHRHTVDHWKCYSTTKWKERWKVVAYFQIKSCICEQKLREVMRTLTHSIGGGSQDSRLLCRGRKQKPGCFRLVYLFVHVATVDCRLSVVHWLKRFGSVIDTVRSFAGAGGVKQKWQYSEGCGVSCSEET